jgi:tetratricopeptide (TPR) repeat protein
MAHHQDEPLCLKDQRVAFTGRLATMTRAQAAALVRARGGRCVKDVGPGTDLLVVGQDGLPLTRKGSLTARLAQARRLQASGRLAILSEEQFFSRLGLAAEAEDVRRLHSLPQLCQTLGVSGDRLRAWVRAGWIVPIQTVDGVPYFDFRQVAAARGLVALVHAGVPPAKIRRSLLRLARCMPALDLPFERLALMEEPDLLFRLDDGQLAEPSGQRRFEFAEVDDLPVVARHAEPETAEQWWEAGLAFEEADQLAEAENAYRRALRLGGPHAQLCFNLGNVLAKLGKHAQAAERFWQAVELEPRYAQAWNNLGAVLAGLGELDEAIGAYRQAMCLDPTSADAHYNLADVLEQAGQVAEARVRWQAFLRLESGGEWAAYARARLSHG